MTNPADKYIADLIEDLAAKAVRFTTNSADRQKLIDQIAQLRASMNPTIIQENKKD